MATREQPNWVHMAFTIQQHERLNHRRKVMRGLLGAAAVAFAVGGSLWLAS